MVTSLLPDSNDLTKNGQAPGESLRYRCGVVSEPSKPGSRMRSRIRGIAVDISPLRQSRDFRLLFFGMSVSSMGSAMVMVALPYQVWDVTRSALAVGLLGATEFVPLVICSIVGGAIADAHERRRLMTWILLGEALVSGLLVFNAATWKSLPMVYVLSAAMAAGFGFSIPTRRSWSPRLVAPEKLPAMAALEGSSFGISHLTGPMLGGVAIALLGLPATYAIDGLTFVFALSMIRAMRPSPASEHAPAPGFKSILEGFSFLKGRPTLTGSFVIDLNAMIFGMPKALFPAMAAIMGGGPKALGLLYAAPSAGSFVAMAASGWTGKVRRQGLAVTIAVLGWGAAIAAFGLTRSIPLAVLCLAVAGFSDAVSGIFRTAIVQEVTPDHLRGRLSGMEIAVYAGGPTLGDVEAGVVAGLTSVRFSIVSGGLACLVGAGLTALMLPQFIRYDRTRAAATAAEEKLLDEPRSAT